MKVAKIENGAVTEVRELHEMFPTTSFSEDGPDADFLTEMGVMIVDDEVAYSIATHNLEQVAPYIDGTVVRTVATVAKSPAEVTAYESSRRAAKVAAFQAEAGRRLDKFAIDRGYGSMISVCTYDTSSVPRYAADALRARTLRDQWWAALNTIVADVLSSARPEPADFDEIAGELPALTWE